MSNLFSTIRFRKSSQSGEKIKPTFSDLFVEVFSWAAAAITLLLMVKSVFYFLL
jgi:hypothetical protein